LVRLFAGAADVTDALGLVGPGAALRQLPVDDAGENVAPHRQPEHLVGELDVADLLIVEVAHGQFHGAPSSLGVSGGASAGASAAVSAAGSSAGISAGAAALASPRNPAGNGSPSGALRLTASLMRTQPPGLPGTAPF